METRISFFVCSTCETFFTFDDKDSNENCEWVSSFEADKEHCDICDEKIADEGGYIISKSLEGVLRMILHKLFEK